MVISIGPAGTGKDIFGRGLRDRRAAGGPRPEIVLTRPVVEAGEKLGFLPGDFYEKVHPYLRPLYDAFFYDHRADRFRLLREDEVIEIVPLGLYAGAHAGARAHHPRRSAEHHARANENVFDAYGTAFQNHHQRGLDSKGFGK